MTPETLATPDIRRFTNHDNILVAFESIAIVFLCLYILYKDRKHSKERLEIAESFKDVVQSNKDLCVSMAIVAEAVRNVRSK